MHSTSKWLRITAANKQPLPYLGYVELDIQVMGVTIPGCGFLIVRDQKDEEPDHAPPGILGMNIDQRCKQLILAEFDSALAGSLDSDWRDAFSMVNGEALTGANSTVRIAGRYRTHVPAASVVTVQAQASKKLPMTKGVIMLEPGGMALPGGLVLVPTLVSADRRVFPVRVLNLALEYVWLPPKARLGVLSRGHLVESEACDVAFRRIFRDQEEVTVNVRSITETKGDWQCPLDRVQIGETPNQQAELRALLREYADVFAVRDEDLGYTDRVKHEVPVTDDTDDVYLSTSLRR